MAQKKLGRVRCIVHTTITSTVRDPRCTSADFPSSSTSLIPCPRTFSSLREIRYPIAVALVRMSSTLAGNAVWTVGGAPMAPSVMGLQL